MRKLMQRVFMLSVLMLVGVVSLGGVSSAAGPAKTLDIGVLLTLSGPGSESFGQMVKGIQYGADWINEKGGINVNGQFYKINLIKEDDKMTPDGAVAGASALVYRHKVKFILGPGIPLFGTATAKIAEDAKVLRFMAISPGLAGQIGPEARYSFLAQATVATTAAAFDYLAKAYPKVKKIALTCPEEQAALFANASAKKEAQKRGYQVVLEEPYTFGTVDFNPLLTKVAASGADALYIGPGMAGWAGNILKTARTLGFSGPIFTGQGVGDLSVVSGMAGNLATDFFSVDYDLDSPQMTPMIKQIVATVKGKYGQKPLSDHLLGWDLVWVLAQMISGAKSVDPTDVKNYWEAVAQFETPYGPGRMGGKQVFGINHVVVKPVALARIQQGKKEHITWITPNFP